MFAEGQYIFGGCVPHGEGAEALEVKRRQGDLDPRESPVVRELDRIFPSANSELVAVARMAIWLADKRHIHVPPGFRELPRVVRRAPVFIQRWSHDNWSVIQGFIQDVRLVDSGFRVIGADETSGA
jgi:hypothetical protein